MKLLMIYADRFAYVPAHKSLSEMPAVSGGDEIEAALVGLVHAEVGDEADPGRIETKLIKNLKWAARKNDTCLIVLHSFSHLAESKADTTFTRDLLCRAERRLSDAGYEVRQTPFGYFLDLDLRAPGRPAARIFASF